MKSSAKTVKQYLAGLPEDRRDALEAIRAVILKNLPKGYEEGMQYGMIGYYVPHEIYPDGYHCDPKQPLPFAALASQKNHMGLYLMCMYSGTDDDAQFRAEWASTGKKLDMGKSCVRFKKLEDVPLKVIGAAIRRISVKKFVERYEDAIKPGGKRKKAATRSAVSKKVASKKKASVGTRKTVRTAASATRRPSTTARKKTVRKKK